MADKAAYYQAICELSRAFGQARNRQELLKRIFQTAIELLSAKAACLYLAQADRAELTPVAQKGLSAAYFRSRKSMLARQIVPLVLKEGYLFIRDAAADPRLEHREAKMAEGIASILGAPVIVRGKTIGVFCLFTAAPRDFSPEEIDFLTLLAQQSGGVMEHARVIDQVHKNTRLFLELAASVNASLEVKEVLGTLTAKIVKFLGVKAASIRLLDEDRQTLELVAGHGLSEKFLRKGPISATKSLSHALTGKPVFIKEVATDSRVQYRQEKLEEGIVSILAVPIKTKEKVIGVLRLYSGAPWEVTADEIELVTALAHLGGLAIQNASLYLMCQSDIKDLKEELWGHKSWF